MRFLDRAEAAKTARKFEWRSGKASPQITLFYTSGATDYAAAAGAITNALGAFGQATLICTDLPWGDFWKDDNKRWKAFYEWRRALGETARLHDAPGHEVDAHEMEPLRQAIVWALRLGWDAELFASRGRHRLRLSLERARQRQGIRHALSRCQDVFGSLSGPRSRGKRSAGILDSC